MKSTSALVLSMAAVAAALLSRRPAAFAQTPPPVEFDVVSIKRHASLDFNSGMQTLPDGTFTMTNSPIRAIIGYASPVEPREVVGLPDWAVNERYDLTAKPPPGSTREQQRAMWRAMFAERMKLMAHVEQRERSTFALQVARSDGRLGPQLKPASPDCTAQARGTPPPNGPPPKASPEDLKNRRCVGLFGPGSITYSAITMDILVNSLAGLAGGIVENRTGLQGLYAVELTFTDQRPAAERDTADDAPGIFTALQEQLGLNLVPQKTMQPIFVVDRIERPSEN